MSKVLVAGFNKLDVGLTPLVLPPSYEVIAPVLLKSLDYPPDCSLDIVSADFSVDSQICQPLEPVWPHRDVCYYPFSLNCQVNYISAGMCSIAVTLIVVAAGDYDAWLNGLTLGYGHYRQSWDIDPYITYYIRGTTREDDIGYSGSCELSLDPGIVLDRSWPDSTEFLMQDYVLPPGSYKVLLWFDFYSQTPAILSRAYGARIYEIGNATLNSK